MGLKERARQAYANYQADQAQRAEQERLDRLERDRVFLVATLQRIGIDYRTKQLASSAEVDGVRFVIERDGLVGESVVRAYVPCSRHGHEHHMFTIFPEDTEEMFLTTLGTMLAEPCFQPEPNPVDDEPTQHDRIAYTQHYR